MPADLSGVDVKLRRAEAHLAAIRGEMEHYIHVVLKDRVLHELEDDATESGWSLLNWTDVPPIDPMLGAVLGDFAHNVRSALDQLMCGPWSS